ncbi:MAG: phosphate ABC transporter substrate-binding protein [Lachnospiraceae bacterium]|nr:phosphate ABC transporter substrate-binding protein [Lachnospiraceae bacterium]
MKERFIATLTALCLTTAIITGCGASGSSEANTAATPAKAETAAEKTSENTETSTTEAKNDAASNTGETQLNGTISLAGSTSMEKLCEAMSESFMEANPGVTVTVEYTGSGAGLESLASGSVDIGDASRALKDDEKANGAVENIVAIDGIAVITDKENSLKDIAAEDLAKIYKGEVANWKEIGGPDQPIVVIGREAGSGTRDAFEEIMEVKDACAYAQELDSTGAVLAKVASTPGSVGYVSLDVVDDTVTGLMIDGVEPTEEKILAGTYLLQRPFVMATMGEVSVQSEVVQGWFNYINSDTGKDVIKKVGLIIPQ